MSGNPSSLSSEREKFLRLRSLMKKEKPQKCLEASEQILAESPQDVDALKVKVACLVAMDKIDDSLAVCADIPELAFEKAYCLYRLNKLEEALKVCEQCEPKGDHVLHLEAQAFYRLQKYDNAIDRYQSISIDNTAGAETDLYCNIYASFASAGRGKEAVESYALDDDIVGDSYELLFNKVCSLLSSGDLKEASDALDRTESLCRDVLTEEGLTDAEIQDEMNKIRLQRSFLGLLNNKRNGVSSNDAIMECLSILRMTSEKKRKNHEMMAVAANNLAVLRGDKDLPDSLRRLRTTISTESEEKLSRNQLMEIRYNRCILLLHMGKVEDATKALDELDIIYGPTTAQGIVLRASIAVLSGDFETSDRLLLTEKKRLEELDSQNEYDIFCKISIIYAQTLITRGKFSDAIITLEGIASLKFSPAGVSSQYYLRALQAVSDKNVDPSRALEESAADYLIEVAEALDSCSDAEYVSSDASKTLLFISDVLRKYQRHEDCAKSLQILLRCGGDDLDSASRIAVTSQLVCELSYYNPEEAERYAQILPRAEFSDEFNAMELEKSDVPRIIKKRVDPGATTADGAVSAVDGRTAAADAKRKRKMAKRRAARREAHLKKLEVEGKFDPSRPVKPDAERWIPTKQRSYNKRGRKNRNKFVGGQGSGDGAQKDMQKLDAYARSQSDKAPAVGTVISSGSSSNKKKKGKGKKK